MSKSYVIWWHSQFIDEINRDATTIEDIVDKASKTIDQLQELKELEKKGKIRVKATHTLNPIYIEILDESIESKVANNPIIEILDE